MTRRPDLQSLSFDRLSGEDFETLSAELSLLTPNVGSDLADGAYWAWRYRHNPAGGATVIVARRGRRAVGKLSNIHLNVTVDGVRTKAGLAEGLFILPDNRDWPCVRGLLEHSLRESVNDGIVFGFSFVNPHAIVLNRQSGWQDLGRIQISTAFLNLGHALSQRGVPFGSLLGAAGGFLLKPRKARTIERYVLRDLEKFDAATDELWHAIESRVGVSIVKDSTYLNWRYRMHPAWRYETIGAWSEERLEGLVIYRSAGPRADGYILDVLCRDESPDVSEALLDAALNRLKAAGVGMVSASFPEASAAAIAAFRLGFVNWATNLWGMNMVVMTDTAVAKLDRRSWHISLGDWIYH